MRTENSIKNISMSLITQFIMMLLGFISRKVFINNLGMDYLGINGLLTSVLSMLSLIEGGVGTSIVYNLYKPLAEGNKAKVAALIQLYKKLYIFYAVGVFILSLMIYPFLRISIEEGIQVSYIGVIYFIFVLKNIISYLNAHKWSLINADQKGYVIAKYNLCFQILTTVLKIYILLKTSNYILFLIIELIIFIIQNLWNGYIVSKNYAYIYDYKNIKIDESTKVNLIKNVKAVFLHNIGTYCVLGTDNLLISLFISLKVTGLYSNYTMVINMVSSFISPILSGVGESVGNLLASNSGMKNYSIFKCIYLVNYWIYSIAVIFLYNLLEPFITWIFGSGLLLDQGAFILILINFYLTGMRITISMFKSKAGLFSQDRYIPLIEATLNLCLSFFFVKYLGLAGIFLGTTVSTILIPLWIQAKIVYNQIFDKSVFIFLKTYFFYLILMVVSLGITSYICQLTGEVNSFFTLAKNGLICIIVPNIIYLSIFIKSEEFLYLVQLFLKNIKGIISKIIIYKKEDDVWA